MLKIALDAMGGDYAPLEIIKGAYLAVDAFDVHIVLLGPESDIQSAISENGFKWPHPKLSITHAPDVVLMCESPTVSFRKKKESSIQVGLNMVKSGDAAGFVSAGNTGAVMMASTLILGRTPDVERPAIASLIPSKKGPILMLDMGSSVDCKPEHLAQFATMGHCFAKDMLKIENPKVGLLNIGEEKEKGNQVAQQAYELIDQLPVDFVGNVEGKDVVEGKAHVVVCDGFVGNSVLKFGEGVSKLFMDFFKEEAKRSFLSMLALLLLSPALKRFKKRFDPDQYGGAPLLGVEGVSIIAHGSSSAEAIKNAIRIAIREVDTKVVENIGGAVHS